MLVSNDEVDLEMLDGQATWRHQIGPFSHKMTDELEKMGIFTTNINVANQECNPFLAENIWQVRLQIDGEKGLGKAITIYRDLIEGTEPNIIADLIYRIHTVRNFNPILC